MNIDELLDTEPSTWNPQEDGTPSKLIGTLVSITAGSGDYGEYPVVTVSNDDGIHRFYAFHGVAKSQLEQANPQPGDKIGIAYKGKKMSGAGNEYHNYRVVSEAVGPRVDQALTPTPMAARPVPDSSNDLGDDEDPF
jgi:hypothetical protein